MIVRIKRTEDEVELQMLLERKKVQPQIFLEHGQERSEVESLKLCLLTDETHF